MLQCLAVGTKLGILKGKNLFEQFVGRNQFEELAGKNI